MSNSVPVVFALHIVDTRARSLYCWRLAFNIFTIFAFLYSFIWFELVEVLSERVHSLYSFFWLFCGHAGICWDLIANVISGCDASESGLWKKHANNRSLTFFFHDVYEFWRYWNSYMRGLSFRMIICGWWFSMMIGWWFFCLCLWN